MTRTNEIQPTFVIEYFLKGQSSYWLTLTLPLKSIPFPLPDLALTQNQLACQLCVITWYDELCSTRYPRVVSESSGLTECAILIWTEYNEYPNYISYYAWKEHGHQHRVMWVDIRIFLYSVYIDSFTREICVNQYSHQKFTKLYKQQYFQKIFQILPL